MRPYGLTFDLQITKPTKAVDMLWDAVEQARIEGMTVRQIKSEMAQAWEHACDEEKKAAKEFLQ
jgi:hypothetical protein